MTPLALVPCPLCKAKGDFRQVRNFSRPDRFIRDLYGKTLYGDAIRSIWRVCSECGFVHQNPRPLSEDLDRWYLESGYHTDPILEAWYQLPKFMGFAHFYYDDKIDYLLSVSGVRAGHAFDVGFGHGGALRILRDRGFTVDGREPDAHLVDFARKTVGIENATQGLVDRKIEVSRQADLVFSNHTFEHVADLHDAVEGISRVLKPGGYVMTVVPTYYANRSSNSIGWMNASHYSMFTDKSLSQLFAYHGFEPVTHTYRGSTKFIDEVWHVARYTGARIDPRQYFENAGRVARYIAVDNRVNSAIGYPVYNNYPAKYRLFERAAAFVRSPVSEWPGKIGRFVSRALKPRS